MQPPLALIRQFVQNNLGKVKLFSWTISVIGHSELEYSTQSSAYWGYLREITIFEYAFLTEFIIFCVMRKYISGWEQEKHNKSWARDLETLSTQ